MKHKNKTNMMKRSLLLFLFVGLFANVGKAQVTVTVDTGMNWVGYMNVFDLSNAYLWGSGWALADIQTTVDAGNGSVRLFPNFNTWDTTDAYWYNSTTGKGNKIMEANTFEEDWGLAGQNLTFQGFVDSMTLDTAYTVEAFIKVLDTANGYATLVHATSPITATGAFSVSDSVPNIAVGMLTQYGFTVKGLNADPALEAQLGNVYIRGNQGPPMPPINVTFQMQAADSTPVYVFGSWTNWSNWPGDTMTSIGNDTYEVTLTVPGNQQVEYLFVHGVGPTKEAMDSTAPCTNMNAQYTNRIANLGFADTTMCHRWETCNSCIPVGIDEITKENLEILVSTKFINLQAQTLTEVDGIEIFDMTGRTVWSSNGKALTNQRIAVDLQSDRLYMIRVHNGNNYHTVKTLIIQ